MKEYPVLFFSIPSQLSSKGMAMNISSLELDGNLRRSHSSFYFAYV
jgi:hypothetical protein